MNAPWWRPDRLAARRSVLEARNRILGAVRHFFAAADYVEVDTPALQVSPGLEPHLRAFTTDLHDPRDGTARRRYLHTSPEFAMKKLLVAGMPRIWQLAHVYRDGERSARLSHQSTLRPGRERPPQPTPLSAKGAPTTTMS